MAGRPSSRAPTIAGPGVGSAAYPLRSFPVIVFGITIAVLFGGALVGYLSARRLIMNERRVAGTDDAIVRLATLLSTLKDAETGQRGYLLTENQVYLQPYRDATVHLQSELAALTRELAPEPAQLARLATLRGLVARKLEELRRTISLDEAGEHAPALAIVRDNSGEVLMEEIRAEVAAMQSAECATLRRRAEQSERSSRATIATIVASTAIGAILLALVLYLSQRSFLTERRSAAEIAAERERLRVTLESIGDAVLTADGDGRITFANRIAESLIGRSSQEMMQRPLEEVFRVVNEQTRGTLESPVQRALRDGAIVGLANHTLLIRTDGTECPIDESAAPIYDTQGRVIGCVLVFRDITERKRIEQRTYEMMIELKDADRHKDEFLALLAHELRGPLAPLRNGLELIKRSQGGEPLLQRTLASMDRQLGQLVRLVNDLLDASRIARGKIDLHREPIELGAVLRDLLEEIRRSISEAAGLTLEATLPHEPLFVDGDAVRLTQVFRNLLQNARKYTEPGGRIELSAAREGEQAVVRVKDTGVGIPSNKLEAIFEMFAQVDHSPERSQGGLGIGLALARRLVELHGGSIVALSEGSGRGSEFVARLPLSPEGRDREMTESVGEHPFVRRRILVVDDNADTAASLALLLQNSGHETSTAHDGLEALATAERLRPDAVLLDLGLPKLDGYEVCRRIRRQPWAKTVILVAISGWGQEQDRLKSKAAGFDAHLVKPPDYTALLRLLATLPRAAGLDVCGEA